MPGNDLARQIKEHLTARQVVELYGFHPDRGGYIQCPFHKGIEFAKAMMDQGADVFFGDASAVDSGARQAIDEANAASGSVKVYDIAQPSDSLGQNECIISSQVTDNSSLVGLCMEAIEGGTFGGETIYGTLQNGVLSAGAISELVPAEVADKYQGYLDQMASDTFMK